MRSHGREVRWLLSHWARSTAWALQPGVKATVINPYYITGIDKEMLESLKADHKTIITLEDGVLEGGFGEKIARFYGDSDVKTLCFGLEKKFYDRYDPAEVLKENHLTPEQIAEDVIKTL